MGEEKNPKLVEKAEAPKAVESSKAPTSGEPVNVPPTADIVAKHKRKYTRKPKDNAEVEAAPAVQQVNTELLKKSIHAIGGSIDGFIVRSFYGKAVKVYRFLEPDNPEEPAKELASSIGITQGELEVVSEATTVLFAQSPFLVRYAPWIMIGGVALSYGTRVVVGFARLDAMEKEIRKLRSEREDSKTDKR